MIEIQHGCIPTNEGWTYVEVNSPSGRIDDVKYAHYTFVTTGTDRPEIGDFIAEGVLVKRRVPKVNSDWSKWKDKDLYGNP